MAARVRIKALRTFTRLGGRVRKGDEIETSEDHARYLTAQGLAERVGKATSTQATGPSSVTPAPEPAEVKSLGGGWYEVRGEKVQGREAALEAARKG